VSLELAKVTNPYTADRYKK